MCETFVCFYSSVKLRCESQPPPHNSPRPPPVSQIANGPFVSVTSSKHSHHYSAFASSGKARTQMEAEIKAKIGCVRYYERQTLDWAREEGKEVEVKERKGKFKTERKEGVEIC